VPSAAVAGGAASSGGGSPNAGAVPSAAVAGGAASSGGGSPNAGAVPNAAVAGGAAASGGGSPNAGAVPNAAVAGGAAPSGGGSPNAGAVPNAAVAGGAAASGGGSPNGGAVPSAAVAGGAAASGGGSPNAGAAPGASAAPDSGPQDAEPLVPITPADVPSMYTYDPWERLNRFTYRFNSRFDEAVFLPVANGYRRVPSPVRYGIHNFFSNLSEVPSVVNYVLQARFIGSVRSLGRFVVNSTIGIGGLFDVASKIRLKNPPTGFSSTLSTWGMHPGPYVVLPLLGPSTLRDTVGFLGDYGIDYGINIADLYRGYQSYGLSTVNAVDQRANVDFRYYATGSPFEYETIRFLYVRKRLIEDEALHGKGKPKQRDAGAPAGK
jgi:phospholipid-binding lipoprotein MlaA